MHGRKCTCRNAISRSARTSVCEKTQKRCAGMRTCDRANSPELCSARSNEYINYVGVLISGIFLDCDARTFKYARQRARYREIRHFHDGRSTSERYAHCAAEYDFNGSSDVSGGVGSAPARFDAPGQHQASG